MLRLLGSLLLVPSLLLPPGMCVCQFARHEASPAAADGHGHPDTGEAVASQCCCGHGAESDEGQLAKAAPDQEHDGVPGSGCGSRLPTDRPHAPGCPALRTVD